MLRPFVGSNLCYPFKLVCRAQTCVRPHDRAESVSPSTSANCPFLLSSSSSRYAEERMYSSSCTCSSESSETFSIRLPSYFVVLLLPFCPAMLQRNQKTPSSFALAQTQGSGKKHTQQTTGIQLAAKRWLIVPMKIKNQRAPSGLAYSSTSFDTSQRV